MVCFTRCNMIWSVIVIVIATISLSETIRPCDSDIYCYGQILHTVAMAKIYKDKYFVDMPLRHEPGVVKRKFQELMMEYNNAPPPEQIKTFLSENFDAVGTDVLSVSPVDWKQNPSNIRAISDENLRRWAEDLNEIWKNLTLQAVVAVRDNPEKFSLIYLPNAFVVAGGRFRESYYWDTYWIIKGLLVSELYKTVKGILENFIHLVKVYGFVPNGGRIYYSSRSQPPYLLPMMEAYVNATGDWGFLRDNIEYLEKEFDFWKKNRSLVVEEKFRLYHYNVQVDSPRPETYRKDVLLARYLEPNKQKELYSELNSGAESGWDFSSRWFRNESLKGNMSDTLTSRIVPVDLNSLLCYNARLLRDFYKHFNNTSKADYYANEANNIDRAINSILWNQTHGIWFDFDLVTKKHREYFYLSNIYPLWTSCYESAVDPKSVRMMALNYIKASKALQYPKGVPASLHYSQLQWDYPNGWSPLHHVLIESLEKLDEHDYAFTIAQQWIQTNYQTYNKTKKMFEKYDVNSGKGGRGNEYDVQVGFGWTNGVVLDLLMKYNGRLKISKPSFVIDKTPLKLSATAAVLSVIAFLLCLVKNKLSSCKPRRRRQRLSRDTTNLDEQELLTANQSDDELI